MKKFQRKMSPHRLQINNNIKNHNERDNKNLNNKRCSMEKPEVIIVSGFDFPITVKNSEFSATKIKQHQEPQKSSEDNENDVISKLIGHFGRWQFFWTFTLSFFQIIATYHIFMYVFQTIPKNFSCTEFSETTQNNSTVFHSSMPVNQNECYYNKSNDILKNNDTNIISCTKYEFSNAEGNWKTLTEEFNLICERQYLVSVVEMCFLAGAAFGSVSSGWISDKFGRKKTLMGFAAIQLLFGVASAFSPTLTFYMVLRAVAGFASMTVTVVSFVLVVELVSGKWRTIIGILNILPVALGYIVVSAIAYYIRDWRHLQLVFSLSSFPLICAWYFIPESPRWLLARGHLNELYRIVERAAKFNKITLPTNYQKAIEAVAPHKSNATIAKTITTTTTATTTTTTTPAASSIPEVVVDRYANTNATSLVATQTTNTMNTDDNKLATPATTTMTKITKSNNEIGCDVNPFYMVFNGVYWRTTVLNLVVWFSMIEIYFGLTLHLSNLGGNIYVNNMIAGSAEALSICCSVFIVLKMGIRRNLIILMLISGIALLTSYILPEDKSGIHNSSVIVLAIIAKCVIGACNAILPTFTAMQYPTIIRNFGLGMGNLAAGIGLSLIPFIWRLEEKDALLPMAVMGVCGIIGSLSVALMKNIE